MSPAEYQLAADLGVAGLALLVALLALRVTLIAIEQRRRRRSERPPTEGD